MRIRKGKFLLIGISLVMILLLGGCIENVEKVPQEEGSGKVRVENFDGKDYYKGSKDARVTIIEYADFQCPYCQRYFKNTFPQIEEEYIKTGKVKYIFRDFPLSFHQYAQKASEATECAGEQGKFWEYHDKLFESGKISLSDLKEYALELGLDTKKFNSCLDSGKFAKEVKEDMSEGQSEGVSGTPTFFINGKKLVGAQPLSNFKEIIDAELRIEKEEKKTTTTSVTTTTTIPRTTITITTAGEAKGKVKIIEYGDFQCPFCARAVATVKQIKSVYGDKAEVEYNHFPLPFHQNAQKAAEASECARDQGKFWEYHDKLFENQNSLSIENLKNYAQDLGLNTKKFITCLDEGEKAELVRKQYQEGASEGVSGTPTFFINGKKLVGAQPFSNFKKVIDSELGVEISGQSSTETGACTPGQPGCYNPTCAAARGRPCDCG